jgi:rare lipoprotein A
VPRIEPRSTRGNPPTYEVFGKRYTLLATAEGYKERGVASWYGPDFHTRPTSSGEPYDMYAMTAAHKTLPIPVYAKVTNLSNGRSVIVRINDRGPFHAGRVIDLSYAAAYRLGIIGVGSGEVEVEAIVPGSAQSTQSAAAEPRPVAAAAEPLSVAPAAEPVSGAAAVQPITTTPLQGEALAAVEPAAAPSPPSPARGVFLQVGAFSSRDNAEKLRARLSSSQEKGELVQLDSLWRVQIGPYGSQDEARSAAERLEPTLGLKPLVVVR